MNKDLEQKLIKLGATNPELRPHIRPLLGLRKAARGDLLTTIKQHATAAQIVKHTVLGDTVVVNCDVTVPLAHYAENLSPTEWKTVAPSIPTSTQVSLWSQGSLPASYLSMPTLKSLPARELAKMDLPNSVLIELLDGVSVVNNGEGGLDQLLYVDWYEVPLMYPDLPFPASTMKDEAINDGGDFKETLTVKGGVLSYKGSGPEIWMANGVGKKLMLNEKPNSGGLYLDFGSEAEANAFVQEVDVGPRGITARYEGRNSVFYTPFGVKNPAVGKVVFVKSISCLANYKPGSVSLSKAPREYLLALLKASQG